MPIFPKLDLNHWNPKNIIQILLYFKSTRLHSTHPMTQTARATQPRAPPAGAAQGQEGP